MQSLNNHSASCSCLWAIAPSSHSLSSTFPFNPLNLCESPPLNCPYIAPCTIILPSDIAFTTDAIPSSLCLNLPVAGNTRVSLVVVTYAKNRTGPVKGAHPDLPQSPSATILNAQLPAGTIVPKVDRQKCCTPLPCTIQRAYQR